MKSLLIVSFCLFFMASTQARELTAKEKLVLTNKDRTLFVLSESMGQIVESRLGIRDRILYRALGLACRPLEQLIERIELADEDYPDQSERLGQMYLACSEGALSMARMHLNQLRE